MDIITRKEAQQQGLTTYYTGKYCKQGHIDTRQTSSGQCSQCSRENSRSYRSKNLEYCRSKHQQWCINNKNTIRKNSSNWAKNNKAKKCEISIRYYASKMRAIPSWFDKKAVLEFYTQAELLSNQTGILHHVDHIIPLQGELVCGLHVQNNLRVITMSENCSKGNNIIDELL